MEKREPPMRLIMPGRVFRNEAISARAHCMFHQIEGLYIDKDVSFADLKQTLLHFARCFFGPTQTSVCVRRTSHSPSPVRRWMSTGDRRRKWTSASPRARGGSRFWAAAWLTQCAGGQRHRPQRVQRFRLWHGHRTHHHAATKLATSAISSRTTDVSWISSPESADPLCGEGGRSAPIRPLPSFRQ